MAESNPPPLPQFGPEGQARMSLPARLLNVFAVPGQVFTDVRNAPVAVSNWLVPTMLAALVGLASVLTILSEPTVQKQFLAKQKQVIDDGVKSGRLTARDKETADRFMGPAVLKIFAGAGAVVGTFLSVFWWGFILWLLARKMLRVQVAFAKALEVAGLAMMINVLGGIVAMLLIINLKKIGATPSLALVVKDFDVTRKGHAFAAAANVFAFWVVGVRSVALAKLTDAPFLRTAWLVATFWVLEQCFFVVSGLGQLAM